MSADIQLRVATEADAATIAGFNARMARETEHLELDPQRLRAGVEALLRDPAKGFYLLACVDASGVERIAGQLMITYEWSDWRNGAFWWIQSVYVREEDRGQGVFSRLYREVHRMARQSGAACGLRLYVEGENRRAQQAYERLGMHERSYRFYETDFVLPGG
jgi:GNAT superfamily N-acetyltransferase